MNKNNKFQETFGIPRNDAAIARARRAKAAAREQRKEKRFLYVVLLALFVSLIVILFSQKSPYPYDITEAQLQNFYNENSSLLANVQRSLANTSYPQLSVKYQNNQIYYFSEQKAITMADESLGALMENYFRICKDANFKGPSVEYQSDPQDTRFIFFFHLDPALENAARAGIRYSDEALQVQEKEGNYSGSLGGLWKYYRYSLPLSPSTTKPLPWRS